MREFARAHRPRPSSDAPRPREASSDLKKVTRRPSSPGEKGSKLRLVEDLPAGNTENLVTTIGPEDLLEDNRPVDSSMSGRDVVEEVSGISMDPAEDGGAIVERSLKKQEENDRTDKAVAEARAQLMAVPDLANNIEPWTEAGNTQAWDDSETRTNPNLRLVKDLTLDKTPDRTPLVAREVLPPPMDFADRTTSIPGADEWGDNPTPRERPGDSNEILRNLGLKAKPHENPQIPLPESDGGSIDSEHSWGVEHSTDKVGFEPPNFVPSGSLSEARIVRSPLQEAGPLRDIAVGRVMPVVEGEIEPGGLLLDDDIDADFYGEPARLPDSAITPIVSESPTVNFYKQFVAVNRGEKSPFTLQKLEQVAGRVNEVQKELSDMEKKGGWFKDFRLGRKKDKLFAETQALKNMVLPMAKKLGLDKNQMLDEILRQAESRTYLTNK